MALSARQELYEILNHWTVTAAGRDAGDPIWGDDVIGDERRNAIADAEMLLSFLAPTFQIDSFSLATIDRVPDRGLALALEQLSKREAGSAKSGHPVVGSAIKNFVERRIHSFVSLPLEEAFSPGIYVSERDGNSGGDAVSALKVVDAYTLTISVCVQAMYLLTTWINHEEHAPSPEVGEVGRTVRAQLIETRQRCSDRLTHALLGLIRSFTVKSYDTQVGPGAPGGYASSREWERKNARAWPNGEEFGWSSRTLATVRRRLGARPEYSTLLRGDDIPFACGFSWGPTSDEFWGDDQMVEAERTHPTFREGETPVWAVDAPYLYFTITAIEGVADLLATKVRSANILTRDQSYLAAQLGFLVENTTLYWRALAFAPRVKAKQGEDAEGWYLERLPWRTADGDRDDYYSLYVIGLILGAREQLLNAAELGRITRLLEELAQRTRITRSPYVFGEMDAADPALRIHHPGKPLELDTADDDVGAATYVWRVDDFAPKLMKLAGVAAQRADDLALRRRALKLADEVWEKNLKHRRFGKYVRGSVWDAPLRPYVVSPELWDGHDADEESTFAAVGLDPAGLEERYSWHITQRVAEALVAVTRGQERSTTSGDHMRVITEEILDSLAERGAAVDAYRTQLSEAEDRLRAEEPSRALQEALAVLTEVEARSNGSSNGSHGSH